MKTSKGSDELKLMHLSSQLINWDKIDANQIIDTLNEFTEICVDNNYKPQDFGISDHAIPSEYIPKAIANITLAVDKQKQAIVADNFPYTVKSITKLKQELKLIKNLDIIPK